MRRGAIIATTAACFAMMTVAACGRNSTASKAQADESQLPIKEFMGHVMQRNAVQLWEWTAFVTDEKGERFTKPVTEEEWEDAESDALTLQQLTYALEHSNYRIADDRWDINLAALRAATAASAKAAERKDFPALQRAGDLINERCVACHLTFAPEIEAPPPPLPPGF